MKKVLMIALAVLISVAFVTTVFSQTATDKATKAATETAKEKGKAAVDTAKEQAVKAATDKPADKPAAATEKKAVKPKTHQFTGEVTAIDTAAKTLNVKGKKDEKTFDLANAKMKKEPKAGDKVLVKYTEADGKNAASSVTITMAAKKTTEKKEAVKKDEKAVAPAAPAKAAAPAPVQK